MRTYSKYVLLAVSLILMIFTSCKRRDQSKIPPQSNHVAQAEAAPTEWEPRFDADCQPLSFPRVFVLTRGKNGTFYRHINGSKEDASEYHSGVKYDVMTTHIPGVAGDRIDVLGHKATQGDTLVVTEADSILFTVGVMGSWFDGVIEDLLVVSISTGPGPQGLWVIDLTTRKLTCNLNADIDAWDGFNMTIWEPIDSLATSENCPESVAWKKAGLRAGFEEECTVDIRTCVTRRSGKFRCVPYQ